MDEAHGSLPEAGNGELAALSRMIHGFRVSQMVCLAAQLGLADMLADGPLSSDELAERSATHPPSLRRLLRALSSPGLFHEDQAGRFGLTPLSQLLRSDVPVSLRGWAMLISDPTVWQSWGQLGHSVRTGDTGFGHLFGTDVWTYRAQHPAASAIFDAAMSSLSGTDIAAVPAVYDFGAMRTLIDVGGGQGTLLAAILRANPHARGILFDQPHVVATAMPLLQAADVADRCEVAGGDFFESLPRGGDAYLMRKVIHDWDDERGAAILRTCRAAMPTRGRLLLIEGVLTGPNLPNPTMISDINMLVMTGGRERSAKEFAALLAQAGFALQAVHPTPGPSSILEAVPA